RRKRWRTSAMAARPTTGSTCRRSGCCSPSRCGATAGWSAAPNDTEPTMRVLFIISELTLGGAQKQVVELARELVRVGHDAAIYTLNDDVPRAKELEGSGVELIVDQKRWKLDPAVIARLRRFIARWRPDILHGFLYDGDIYARLAAAGTGIPVLNSERSDNYTISKVQKVAHHVTRGLVEGVVANSCSGSRFAQRLYGYEEKRMHVVGNGVRVED